MNNILNHEITITADTDTRNDLFNLLTETGKKEDQSKYIERIDKTIESNNKYDRVIMNPPFEGNSDIKHVKHAYKMLKNNGRIVSIMSLHWTFANDKISQNFKDWIDDKQYFTQELPSGIFEMTKVKSQIVIIEKKE